MTDNFRNKNHGSGGGPKIPSDKNAKLMRKATYASVSVALILIVSKLIVWTMSGSIALMSSLLDSSLDLAASLVSLFAVRHALTPADEEHRFGHGKAEALAALGQSILIGVASILLIVESFTRIIQPEPIKAEFWAIGVMVFSLVLTIILVRFQRRVVNETGSIAVLADSTHYLTDIAINIGIIVGLIAVAIFDLRLLDPLIAIAVASYLFYAAIQIARPSFDILMDRELDDTQRNRITQIVISHPEVFAMHDLRTRNSGINCFIQFHLELEGSFDLNHTHRIADEVEALISKEFPESEILIHQDPVGLDEDRPDFA